MTGEGFQRSGDAPLGNLIKLVSPLTNRIFLITGGEEYHSPIHGVEVVKIKTTRRQLMIARVLQQVVTHFRVLLIMAKLRKDIDILIYIFGTPFPIPLVFAQSLDMKCFIILTIEGSGAWAQAVKASDNKQQFGELTRLRINEACERISYYFADKLIAYSPSVIDRMKLRRYVDKIAIYPKYVSDYDLFDAKTKIEERQNLIGYVGRLNEEKGILNLLEAIPQVLSERPDYRFTIIGEGRLSEEIQKFLESNNLGEHVELVGWVAHDELPPWLDKFKLVVIPSYTETGPNLMFECMACGTPVLATRVGAVSDVIEDGETGFLLEDNSPANIARGIIHAMSHPDLKSIAKNAYTYVREEFTYVRTSQAWSKILNNG